MFILSLYVYQEPRRANAYADMKIIKEIDFKKLDDSAQRANNWLVIKSRRNKYFVLTRFKTAKTEGKTIISATKQMNTILNILLKFLDSGDWFLTDSRNNKMTANTLTKHIVNIFKSTKKRISVNMLRHIYTTEHSEAKNINLKRLKEQAHKMGHSIETHIEYIKKD